MKKLFKKLASCICLILSLVPNLNVTKNNGKDVYMKKSTEENEIVFINDVANPNDVSLVNQGEFYEGKILNKNYIMSYSLDRLLVNFYLNSGIDTGFKEYGGWAAKGVGEGDAEITLLGAYSYLYAEEHDEAVLAKINKFVDMIDECQEAYAKMDPANAGYVSAFSVSELDSIEKTGSAFWPIFYTFAKNLEGYYDAYKFANSQKSYKIWYNLGKYLATRVSKYDEETNKRVLKFEYGDIAICFFQLYLETNEQVFLDAAFKFVDKDVFDKMYANEDPFSYVHCNRSIPVVRSALFAYLATKDEKYLQIGINGFELMTKERTYANGNNSELEELHPTRQVETVGFQNAETCCAYNYMKCCDLLYRITNNKYYMDYYENLLYNQILASIDWDSGMKTYYISMDYGYYKVYHDAENSFWCCTATGWENFAKFNQNIYYHNNNSLIVNLFINSQINDTVTGLGLKQKHNFPSENVVSFEVTKEATTNLKVRYPAWVSGQATMSYNGKLIDLNISNDGYININRAFKVGDIIKIKFPMSFRLSHLESDTEPHSDAIMYGPIMMSGIIESIGEISPILTNSNIGQSKDNKIKNELFYSGNSIFDNVKKVDDLTYLLKADNQEVLISAFYKCYKVKYIVYWNIFKTESKEYYDYLYECSYKKSNEIDFINVGNYFSETAHNFFHNNKSWTGNCFTKCNRGMVVDGYIGYTIAVEKGVKNELAITHFGTDNNYSYDIYINDNKEFSVSVEYKGREFYNKYFDIPEKYSENSDKITVKILCTKGTLTTGIYEMRTLREELPLQNDTHIDLNAGESSNIDFKNFLYDRLSFDGTGNIRIKNQDGTILYEGPSKGTIKEYMQLGVVTIEALSDVSVRLQAYGDKVVYIDDINYKVANNDLYYPTQFAIIHLENSGTLRLRIDWSTTTLTRGNQTGKVKVYNTNLDVNYNISYNSLNDGLVLYYDFENIENNIVKDKSNNGNDGTIIGEYNSCQGKFGNGVNLNGTSYVSFGKVKGISNEITLSMDVKYNDTTNGLFERLFDLGNDYNNYLTMTTSGYACGKQDGISYSVNQQIYSLKPNTWYNVTLTIKGNLAISYVNGVEVSRSEQFVYDLSNVESYLLNYIGKSHVDYTPNLNGVIDEIRIYNYALSKDQVIGLFNVKNVDENKFASADIMYEIIEEKDIDITIIPEEKDNDDSINFDEPSIITPTPNKQKTNYVPIVVASIATVTLLSILGIYIGKRRKVKC